MRRDLELVLSILQHLEERDEVSMIQVPQLPGYSDDVVAYHCRRMYEAGLLDAEAEMSSTTPSRIINVMPFGLTWEGHEFNDAMRNDTVARSVRQRLGGALINAPFVLIKELALALGRQQLGLP